MVELRWTVAGSANGAKVYRSECGRYRLTSEKVRRHLQGGYRATSYREWTVVDRATGADLATATSLQGAKDKALEHATVTAVAA